MNKSKGSQLPKSCMSPTGPYTTGCMDLMVGRNSEGTLARVFYPTCLSSSQEHESKYASWFLGKEYSKGMANYFSPWLLTPLYRCFSNRNFKKSVIPAILEAPLADGVFPLVIFSHGLLAHRSLYSSVCNDIASHGFIVAAIEHRDFSACATFTLTPSRVKEWHYIKPVTSIKTQFDLRFSQVQTRATECSRTLEVFERLNRGEIPKNELLSSLPLTIFAGRIDTSQPILAGHSFGGATVMLALTRDKRFKSGICLDPWLFPLYGYGRNPTSLSEQEIEEMKSLSDDIQQPMLFILMEAFQDKKNLQALRHYTEKKRNKFWTLLKSSHLNQTDGPLLLEKHPSIIKKLVDCISIIPPELALKINNSLMINFICDSLGVNMKKNPEFLTKNRKWITEGASGSAKYMVGWHNKLIKVGK